MKRHQHRKGKMVLRLVSACAFLLLSSCIPFPHGGYYRPSLEGAPTELLRRSCGGQVGPEEVLRLIVDGVEMRISFQNNTGELGGHIAITVAAGSKFRFTDDNFIFTDMGRSISVEAVHKGLGYYDAKARANASEPIDSVLTGRIGRSVDLVAPSFSSSAFRLQLPPFIVNDKPHVISPITVEYRAFDFGIYPFNC